jgi:hypothetical protein
MKIKIYTIISLIFSLSSFAQTSSQLTPSAETGKYFNLVNQRFLLNGDESHDQISTFFRHNDTNLPSELKSGFWLIDSYTYQIWNYASWQNDSGEVYTYNQNNLLSEKRIRSWISSQWIDIYRYLYLYDSSLRISTLTEQYNSGGSWVDSFGEEVAVLADNELASGNYDIV